MNKAFSLIFKKTPCYFSTSSIYSPAILHTPKRFNWPQDKLMKRTEGSYYADPKDVAYIVCRHFALHDSVKDPSKITLNSTFKDIGCSDLDTIEVLLFLEQHFNIELPDEN